MYQYPFTVALWTRHHQWTKIDQVLLLDCYFALFWSLESSNVIEASANMMLLLSAISLHTIPKRIVIGFIAARLRKEVMMHKNILFLGSDEQKHVENRNYSHFLFLEAKRLLRAKDDNGKENPAIPKILVVEMKEGTKVNIICVLTMCPIEANTKRLARILVDLGQQDIQNDHYLTEGRFVQARLCRSAKQQQFFCKTMRYNPDA
ncbi:hypothetical protein EDC96DRAFT_547875 [Choanephora cucurbitarum]|nr:hypothetical protein EDC96DRAFT_547875 [Choanephora cucurbitarum]